MASAISGHVNVDLVLLAVLTRSAFLTVPSKGSIVIFALGVQKEPSLQGLRRASKRAAGTAFPSHAKHLR